MSKNSEKAIESFLKNRIITCSRTRAGKIINSPSKLKHLHGVISIGTPGGRKAPYRFERCTKPKLRLLFDDVEYDYHNNSSPPSYYDVLRIIEFGNKILQDFDKDQFILCHCDAGISRSTATGFILRCLLLGPGKEEEAAAALDVENDLADPNRLMVEYADIILDRQGAMTEAVKDFYLPLERVVFNWF